MKELMNITFYSGTRNTCSDSLRSWLSLKENRIQFDCIMIDDQKQINCEKLPQLKMRPFSNTLPLLVCDDFTVFGSLAIMQFANSVGSTKMPLLSSSENAEALSLLTWATTRSMEICSHLPFASSFYVEKRRLNAVEIVECKMLFNWLTCYLKSYEGPFLFSKLSLADLAFVPTLIRIFSHYPPIEDYPLVEAWSRQLLSLKSVRVWMKDAEQLPPINLDFYLAKSQILPHSNLF